MKLLILISTLMRSISLFLMLSAWDSSADVVAGAQILNFSGVAREVAGGYVHGPPNASSEVSLNFAGEALFPTYNLQGDRGDGLQAEVIESGMISQSVVGSADGKTLTYHLDERYSGLVDVPQISGTACRISGEILFGGEGQSPTRYTIEISKNEPSAILSRTGVYVEDGHGIPYPVPFGVSTGIFDQNGISGNNGARFRIQPECYYDISEPMSMEQSLSVTVKLEELGVNVQGRVYNSGDQTPLSEAKVSIGSSFATSDSAGYYQIHLPSSGTYEASVSHSHFETKAVSLQITPRGVDIIDFTLHPYILEGNVFDKSDHHPLLGAGVQVGGAAIAVTDTTGHYGITDIPYGKYVLGVQKDGYSRYSEELSVLTPITKDFELSGELQVEITPIDLFVPRNSPGEFTPLRMNIRVKVRVGDLPAPGASIDLTTSVPTFTEHENDLQISEFFGTADSSGVFDFAFEIPDPAFVATGSINTATAKVTFSDQRGSGVGDLFSTFDVGLPAEVGPLTADQAATIRDLVSWQTLAQPSPPREPFRSHWANWLLELVGLILEQQEGLQFYNPQAGDKISISLYVYQIPSLGRVYLMRGGVGRSLGSPGAPFTEILRDSKWFSDEGEFYNEALGVMGTSSELIDITIASPVLPTLVFEDGTRVGYDQHSYKRVVERAALLSRDGAHPFRIVASRRSADHSQLHLIGTNTGEYTVTIATVDLLGAKTGPSILHGVTSSGTENSVSIEGALTVMPVPMISSAQLTANMFSFSFDTIANWKYRILSGTNLLYDSWKIICDNITCTNQSYRASIPVEQDVTKRYYSVQPFQ